MKIFGLPQVVHNMVPRVSVLKNQDFPLTTNGSDLLTWITELIP